MQHLPELFEEIQKKTGYLIFYRDKLLKKGPKKKVSFEVNNTPVADALKQALHDTGLTYAINGRQISYYGQRSECARPARYRNIDKGPGIRYP